MMLMLLITTGQEELDFHFSCFQKSAGFFHVVALSSSASLSGGSDPEPFRYEASFLFSISVWGEMSWNSSRPGSPTRSPRACLQEPMKIGTSCPEDVRELNLLHFFFFLLSYLVFVSHLTLMIRSFVYALTEELLQGFHAIWGTLEEPRFPKHWSWWGKKFD